MEGKQRGRHIEPRECTHQCYYDSSTHKDYFIKKCVNLQAYNHATEGKLLTSEKIWPCLAAEKRVKEIKEKVLTKTCTVDKFLL